MVFNASDSEDILQEVGVTAWERFSEYDPKRDFVAWACGIARIKILNLSKSSSLHVVLSEGQMDWVEDEIVRQSPTLELQYEALKNCLARLKDNERYLLLARYTEGVTLKNAATRAGLSVQALYKSIQRLQLRLFDCVTRKMRSGELG